MKPGWTWPPSSWTLTLKQLKWKQSPRDSMIMAAPLPSGVLQNEHIFLPLTDLDYRKHHLKHSNTDLHMAHVGWKHILETTRIWETHGNGWVVWFRSAVLKWFCFTSPREYQIVDHTKCQQKCIMVQSHQQNFCEIFTSKKGPLFIDNRVAQLTRHFETSSFLLVNAICVTNLNLESDAKSVFEKLSHSSKIPDCTYSYWNYFILTMKIHKTMVCDSNFSVFIY